MEAPLAGVTVLELTQYIAGPYAGQQLADLGARVIKIERPGEGDPFRRFITKGNVDGYAHNFCAFNRNKESMTLDLQTARGKAVFLALAERADVVLENFRAGVMDRIGLGYEVLKARNPKLVYCSISGFSEDGPYRNRPAFDTVGQALSGLLHLFTDPADPRMRGPTITDQITALQASNAVAAALYGRDRTGVGARIDISMLDAAISYMPDSFTAWTQAHIDMQPEARTAWSHSFVFMCGDERMIAVHTGGPEPMWQGMLRATETPEIGVDPRFCTRPLRIQNFRALIEAFRPAFLRHPRVEWMRRFLAEDVPVAEIHTVPEAMADPEVVHSKLFRNEVHPVHGPMVVLGRTARINGSREPDPQLPPTLGEDTEQVLRDFGFSEGEITGLRDDKTV